MPADRRELIKTDGTVTQLPCRRHSLAELRKMIGAQACDVFKVGDGKHVCIVDDEGALFHRPINRTATELYRAMCKAGTTWSIHGDVVIVPDADFEYSVPIHKPLQEE